MANLFAIWKYVVITAVYFVFCFFFFWWGSNVYVHLLCYAPISVLNTIFPADIHTHAEEKNWSKIGEKKRETTKELRTWTWTQEVDRREKNGFNINFAYANEFTWSGWAAQWAHCFTYIQFSHMCGDNLHFFSSLPAAFFFK